MPADEPVPARRPVAELLGTGVLAGAIATGAAGAIDAVWSWPVAAQFVPGVTARLRFVAYTTTSHALAGALLGLGLTAALLVLARGSRAGELADFGAATHRARRAADPRTALTGLSLVLAGLPMVGLALAACYTRILPVVGNRHDMGLVVAVVIAATLGALLVAIPLTLVVARAVETALAASPAVARVASAPAAPPLAAAALVGLVLAAWLHHSWETAQLLPLHAPAVVVVAVALAWPAARTGAALVARLAAVRRAIVRRVLWIALVPALALVTFALGAPSGVMKAASAYTGLGAPLARALRGGFDWDRDGYARVLGGGDCDDLDRDVHPGAPEVPDDGIDQNCIGGDAHVPVHTAADAAFAPVPDAVPKDFDVLLITIDTMRADHLGAYGYARPTSPSLDALAASGQLFTNGWAHAPSTRYSMPAITTGRLPLDVRYDTSSEGWPGLSLDATTIAESLKPLGFVTGGITNYSYFDRSRHFDQGIDEYDNEDARLHTSVSNAGPEQTHGSSSLQQTDKALAFVEKHAGQRWFLWVHYYDPHFAYEPHAEVPAFGTDPMALYDGEVRFTDMHIGRLLDGLKAKGLDGKTVVVVTGDHGEGFGEHGVTMHGYHLYAAQTKVPMIFRVPGLPAHHAAMPAGHVDILPTLVNLAGGAPTAEMMGQSLVPALASPAAADGDRVVFQQLSYENNNEMRAAVSKQCHVIYNVSPDTSWEVYRVDADPGETTDLSDDDDVCADTRRALEHWYDQSTVPPGAAEALLAQRPPIAAPLDADYGDAVRLLGVELAPVHPRPGDKLALTWTFEARDRVPAGWKLFVHVEGPNKALVANGDHDPARPFAWWRAGQIIRYTTTVALPRTAMMGKYVVWAGLFHGADRAPVRGTHAPVDKDAVQVAAFEVAPLPPPPPPGTGSGSGSGSAGL